MIKHKDKLLKKINKKYCPHQFLITIPIHLNLLLAIKICRPILTTRKNFWNKFNSTKTTLSLCKKNRFQRSIVRI